MLGASFDTPADNKSFADAQGFRFRLLSDTDKAAGRRYEVLRAPDASNPDLPLRIAYLIAPDGSVRRAYEVSDVNGFAETILADLASLEGA